MKLNKAIVELETGAAILDFVETRWTELEEAHLVTALNRLSKSRDGPGLLGHSVLKRVTAALHRRAQQSCAEANAPGGNLRSMTPRHLANTVWALARLSVNDPPLIKDLAEAALRQLSEFKPQELASTLWA